MSKMKYRRYIVHILTDSQLFTAVYRILHLPEWSTFSMCHSYYLSLIFFYLRTYYSFIAAPRLCENGSIFPDKIVDFPILLLSFIYGILY